MQRRYVSIWFKNPDIDWLMRKRPDLRDYPVAFQTTVRNKLAIVSLNDTARSSGIRERTTLADTKFLCPNLQAFDHDPNLTPALLGVLSDWCFRYTPIVAVDEPDGIILDVTGCTHLHGSERGFLASLVNKLISIGYNVRGAMADTPGAAWANARYGTKQPIIPSGETMAYLAPLPIHALRLCCETIDRLDSLGLRTIGQLTPIPRPMLLKRYGKEVVQRLDQANGATEEHLTSRIPAPDLAVQLDVVETVSTPEGIALAAERLVGDLCQVLEQHRHGVRQMRLCAYRIDNKMQAIVIGTASPTRNAKHLLRLLKEKLGSLEPGLGFELFCLSAYLVNPMDAKQNQLLPDASADHRQSTLEMIDRVGTKIGAERIVRFEPKDSHWPNRAYFTKVASEKAAKAWPQHLVRPTRLLEKPVEIQVMAQVPDHPPKRFQHDGVWKTVRLADGPERIEGEWWRQNHEMRDYYRLEDDKGCRYWIYRDGQYGGLQAPRWFLHGFL